ncbi:MAG: O-antigen acetylase [Deltaproteobacteria bacterium]|nr:O-antigen acetylase [Deltaproteobacteria bacterium]
MMSYDARRRMERERIEQFDGLRAFAFFGVFLHHAIKLPLGWVGVDLFFVLSGFLITRNLFSLGETTSLRRSFAVFYFRRVLRILPPYYVALAAMLIVQPIAAGDAAWYFAFISNVHDVAYGQIKGAYSTMWSIAVEEQFYMLWPCLVLLLPRRALAVCFVTVILAAPLFRYVFTPLGFDAVYALMPSRMDLLASGALLALIELHAPDALRVRSTSALLVAILAVGVFAAISISVPTFRTNLNLPLFNVVGFGLTAVFAISTFVYVRSLERGPLLALLNHPVLQYIGRISYMCYLIHMVAIAVAKMAGLGRYPTAALALAGTLGFATASYYLLEKPLQRFRGLVPPQRAT